MTVRTKLLYLVLFMLVFGSIGLVIYGFQTKSTPIKQSPGIPTPTPVRINTSATQPTKTAVTYNIEKSKQLLQTIKTRPTLSVQDQEARDRLITGLGNQSGVLISGSLFEGFYVKEPNTFEVEILTTDIATAKQAAVNWFLSQGFTDEGICLLPVEFYLDYTVANELRGKNIILNPLAEGC